jgi:hypothetical protein
MGILTSRLAVRLFAVILAIVSVDTAHAAQPVNACLAIKGKIYIYFFERPFDTQAGGHFAAGGRIAFNSSVEKDGSVLGSVRLLFAVKRPVEAFPTCTPRSDGTVDNCEHGAQQILKVTCVSTAGQGRIFFSVNNGGEAGSWGFSTSDGGKTLWTEASHGGGSRWVFQELDRRGRAVVNDLPRSGYLEQPPGQ